MLITHDLAIGGLQQVVVNLCRTIDREKFHVSVLCLRALGALLNEIEQLGIKVILLPQKENGTDYFSFLKVAKILKSEKIQVIHTHNTQPLVDGTLGSLFSGGIKRIIHTDHARQFPDKKRYMFAEWLMSHLVYKMVGVSLQTTENLRKYERIASDKLMTITNGINGRTFDIKIDKYSKKKELGISFDGPVIGVISRIEKVKGINFLLQALPGIIKRYPDLTLLIVGDGTELKYLFDESKELGLTNHVIFTGSRLDIPEILQLLDIYILPSLSEGLPLGLLEAMASGCPIVASNVGGIPSVVTHEISALLVPPGDPETLTTTIIQLLDNIELQKRLSNVARELFNQHYNAEQMTRRYSELYI
jgi:glycosyltransferase involved in cell wall biosynthesis